MKSDNLAQTYPPSEGALFAEQVSPASFWLRMFVLTMPLMSFAVFYKIQLSFLAGFFGLAAFGLRYLGGKERISPLLPWPLIAFFAVVVASAPMSLMIFSGDFMGETPLFKSFKQIFQLAFMIGLFVWIRSLVDSQYRLRQVTKYLYISTIVVCLYGFYQFVGVLRGWPLSSGFENPAFPVSSDSAARGFSLASAGGGFYDIPRVYATASEPGFLANFLLLPLSIALASVISKKGLRRGSIFLEYSVVGLASTVLMLTFSRAGYVAAVVSLLVILFSSRGWRERHRHMASGFAVVGIMIAVVFVAGNFLTSSSDSDTDKGLGSYVFEMFERAGDPLEDSTFGRINADAAAMGMFKDHPILGVGIGNFGFLYDHYAPTPETDIWPSAQSMYLGLLAESGVLGLLAFLSLLVWAVRKGREAIHRFGRDSYPGVVTIGLIASLIAIQFQFLFIYALNFTQVWFNLALLGAVWQMSGAARKLPVARAAAAGRE